jgi:hypothetical protein
MITSLAVTTRQNIMGKKVLCWHQIDKDTIPTSTFFLCNWHIYYFILSLFFIIFFLFFSLSFFFFEKNTIFYSLQLEYLSPVSMPCRSTMLSFITWRVFVRRIKHERALNPTTQYIYWLPPSPKANHPLALESVIRF